MKKIVTVALMMLMGSYSAAQTQETTMVTEGEAAARENAARQEAARHMAEMREATQMEEATKSFLGLKWGLGIGVMGGFGGGTAVEKASLVGPNKIVRVDEEGDMRPQMFLEMHVFLEDFGSKMESWRSYKKRMSDYRKKAEGVQGGVPPMMQEDEAPLRGFGPFIALQGGDDEVINALALGVMWGFRRDAKASNSVNVGLGLSFDPSVQVLGHGIEEGQQLPPGETELRFKKEGQFGWAFMASFTF